MAFIIRPLSIINTYVVLIITLLDFFKTIIIFIYQILLSLKYCWLSLMLYSLVFISKALAYIRIILDSINTNIISMGRHLRVVSIHIILIYNNTISPSLLAFISLHLAFNNNPLAFKIHLWHSLTPLWMTSRPYRRILTPLWLSWVQRLSCRREKPFKHMVEH